MIGPMKKASRMKPWMLLAWALALFQIAAQAGPVVRQFSSELAAHENLQARQPERAVRYADGAAGQALRALLEPARAERVIGDYFDSMNNATIGDPQVERQLLPLIRRYDAALLASPREFEAEYLDTANWTAILHRGKLLAARQRLARSLDNEKRAPQLARERQLNAVDTANLLKLMELGRVSSETGVTILRAEARRSAVDLRAKVAANLFSPAGAARALGLAGAIEENEASP